MSATVKKFFDTAKPNDKKAKREKREKKEGREKKENNNELKNMDKFAQIIMLLRASVTVRHQSEKLSMRAFTIKGPTDMRVPDSDSVIDFATLDAFSAVLTQSCGVVAAGFRNHSKLTMSVLRGPITDATIDYQNQVSMRPLKITVAVNPDSMFNAKVANNNELNAAFLQGENLWKEIKAADLDDIDPIRSIANCNPVSLGTHAQTVSGYLNDYPRIPMGSTGKAKEQQECRTKFFNYLLSVCWDKMHRRLTSWPGLGLIHLLDQNWTSERHSIETYTEWTSLSTSVAGDKSLCEFLKANGWIFAALHKFIFSNDNDPFLELRKAAKVGVTQDPLLTKRTIEGYHKLVLGTFIMLTVTLEDVKAASDKWKKTEESALKEKLKEKMMKCLIEVKLYTHALLSILGSHSFRDYLNIVVGHRVHNILPKFEDKKIYLNEWDVRTSQLRAKNVVPVNVNDTEVISETVVGDSDKNDAGGVDASDENDADSDPDSSSQIPKVDYGFEGLIRWIRSFVQQFLGKRHLEDKVEQGYKFDKGISIEISVICCDRVKYIVPEWDAFKTHVGDALKKCPGNPYTSESVVQALIEEFQTEGRKYHTATKYVDFFKELLKRPPDRAKKIMTLLLGVHCEAFLAALCLYSDHIIHEEKDRELSDLKIDPSMISVSKLCCPVCWELLEVLRPKIPTHIPPPTLVVRGFHSDIYPLMLPPGLPSDDYDEMVSRFLRYLGEELVALMNHRLDSEAERSRRSLDSNMSQESGMSIGSASSNEATTYDGGITLTREWYQ